MCCVVSRHYSTGLGGCGFVVMCSPHYRWVWVCGNVQSSLQVGVVCGNVQSPHYRWVWVCGDVQCPHYRWVWVCGNVQSSLQVGVGLW